MSNPAMSCPGLDGANPLTMLAGLGLFSIGSRRRLMDGMGWEWQGGWRPFFRINVGGSREAIIAAVIDELVGAEAAEARASLESRVGDKTALETNLQIAEEKARRLPTGKELKDTKRLVSALKQSLRDLKTQIADAADRLDKVSNEAVAQRHPVTRAALHLADNEKGGLSREAFVDLAKASAPAAYLAGLACDGQLSGQNKRIIARTHLSFANNNSGKMLLKDFAAVARLASKDRVEDALFGAGTPRDEITGLGWDPASQRSYALQFSDPGKAQVSCQSIHNALAFMGLEFFPVVPLGGDRRATIGVHEIRMTREADMNDGTDSQGGEEEAAEGGTRAYQRGAEFLTWPIWDGVLGIDEVKALITRPEMAAPVPDPAMCRTIGIPVVLRSRRVTIDKRSYLTQARPVA